MQFRRKIKDIALLGEVGTAFASENSIFYNDLPF